MDGCHRWSGSVDREPANGRGISGSIPDSRSFWDPETPFISKLGAIRDHQPQCFACPKAGGAWGRQWELHVGGRRVKNSQMVAYGWRLFIHRGV